MENMKAYKNFKKCKGMEDFENAARKDIIVTTYKYEEEPQKNGDVLLKKVEIKTNLTKKINETVKSLKAESIEEKIEELRKSLAKEGE